MGGELLAFLFVCFKQACLWNTRQIWQQANTSGAERWYRGMWGPSKGSVYFSLEGGNKVGKTSDRPRLADMCQQVWMPEVFVSSKASGHRWCLATTFRGMR